MAAAGADGKCTLKWDEPLVCLMVPETRPLSKTSARYAQLEKLCNDNKSPISKSLCMAALMDATETVLVKRYARRITPVHPPIDLTIDAAAPPSSSVSHGEVIQWVHPGGLIPNATVRRGPTRHTELAVIGRLDTRVSANSVFKRWKLLALKGEMFRDEMKRHGIQNVQAINNDPGVMGLWGIERLNAASTQLAKPCVHWEVSVQPVTSFSECAVCFKARRCATVVMCPSNCYYDGMCQSCVGLVRACPICRKDITQSTACILQSIDNS